MPDVIERISKQRWRNNRNRRNAGAGSDSRILSRFTWLELVGDVAALEPRAFAAIFASTAVRNRGIDDSPVRYASSSPPTIGSSASGYGDIIANAAPPMKISRFHGYRNACLTYEPSFGPEDSLGGGAGLSDELRRS